MYYNYQQHHQRPQNFNLNDSGKSGNDGDNIYHHLLIRRQQHLIFLSKLVGLINNCNNNFKNNHWSIIIEWIPYDRFKDIKQIDRGGFGTIHYTVEVALKKFDNFVNLNDVLNEMSFHLKTYIRSYNILIRFYGITQEPETHSYMIVLYYAADGNLREYLKINFNNFNWEQKLDSIPGNILSSDFEDSFFLKILDFELSKLMEENPNNTEKKNIFGVFPYIAPEVLSDARVTNRPTFKELMYEFDKYKIQIENFEKLSKNLRLKNSTTTTLLNYQTHPQTIYTSRLLNFSKLPKPKNEENFEGNLKN
ncbi:hypothetical protein Glove_574g26 [Diversispora epigaea]|uniref:Protein kinase domain-containing protein n=1 Tax=Diversispora epigaea TaxID=1348612 RepID=A0A397GE55_9GLOM|nr:hypothetical protein Glove_574g26 [Diversispora epigaea]